MVSLHWSQIELGENNVSMQAPPNNVSMQAPPNNISMQAPPTTKPFCELSVYLLSNRESKKGLIIDDVFYGGMTPRDIVFTVTVWLG